MPWNWAKERTEDTQTGEAGRFILHESRADPARAVEAFSGIFTLFFSSHFFSSSVRSASSVSSNCWRVQVLLLHDSPNTCRNLCLIRQTRQTPPPPLSSAFCRPSLCIGCASPTHSSDHAHHGGRQSPSRRPALRAGPRRAQVVVSPGLVPVPIPVPAPSRLPGLRPVPQAKSQVRPGQ
jgi:hypothetical protein